jgi:hypothetical protein
LPVYYSSIIRLVLPPTDNATSLSGSREKTWFPIIIMSIVSKETSFVTKVVASVVGLAAGVFMLGLFQVTTAHAQQSNAELQAQIQSLLSTIDQLQAQVDGQASASTAAGMYSNCNPAIYNAELGQGARGQGVMALQQFLNMSADTRVAASGPGSPGNETSYYGPLTAQAVTSFQEKFSADVLAPLGLMSGTGYWGSSTGSKAQELCTSSGMDDSGDDGMSGDLEDLLGDSGDDGDTGTSTDDDSDDEEELTGGEASLEDFDLRNGSDRDVAEGSMAEVADLNFDVEDGDVRVARADLTFGLTTDPGNADADPWDNFEEITLLDESGDELASVQADDEDDWLSDDPLNGGNDDGSTSIDEGSNDFYQIRLSGLNHVVEEGDEFQGTIQVEAQGNVDDAQNTPSWDVAVLGDDVRARDGEGIDQYTGDDNDSVTFDVEEEGQNEELTFRNSSNNPDSSILQVESNQTSDDYGVFVFDVEAEEGDITVDDLPTTFTTYSTGTAATTTFGDVVRDVYLDVEGQQFDYDTEAEEGSEDRNVGGVSRTVSTSTVTFDLDDEVEFEEDEQVEVTMFVAFNQQSDYDQGTSIKAEISDTNRQNITAEGADDLDSSDISGVPSGEIHDLRTEGVYIEENSDSASTDDQGDNTASNNEGVYTVEYDLTAFEGDFYVPNGAVEATSSSVSQDSGARFSIEDNNGDSIASTTGTSSATLSSSADTASGNSNVWRIDQDTTETFTLKVYFDPADNSQYRTQLEAARYADNTSDAADADFTENNGDVDGEVQAAPAQDFETDYVKPGN